MLKINYKRLFQSLVKIGYSAINKKQWKRLWRRWRRKFLLVSILNRRYSNNDQIRTSKFRKRKFWRKINRLCEIFGQFMFMDELNLFSVQVYRLLDLHLLRKRLQLFWLCIFILPCSCWFYRNFYFDICLLWMDHYFHQRHRFWFVRSFR